jgi:hypothetical protein
MADSRKPVSNDWVALPLRLEANGSELGSETGTPLSHRKFLVSVLVSVGFGFRCDLVRQPAMQPTTKAASILGSCDVVPVGALGCFWLKRIRNPMLYPFELRAPVMQSITFQNSY